MSITFQYSGATFTVETPREVAELLAVLKKQEAEQVLQRKREQADAVIARYRKRFSDSMDQSAHQIGAYDEEQFVWTPDRFTAFVDHLGKTPKIALAFLLRKRSVTDEELRDALDLHGNQALAGVLSGISKQAKALFIPPRAIFDLENSRVGGKRRSDYLVTDEFRKIAAEMNWPPPTFTSRS